MKKKSILLLAGLLVLTLAGCGNNAQNASSAAGSVSEAIESTVESTEESTEASEESSEASEEVVEETYSLKEFFAERGIKVGTCFTTKMISNLSLNNIVVSQFNSLTMENSMKPDAILSQKLSKENGELTVQFGSDAIKMLDWAKKNGYSMRGHTLVWYSQTPSWIFYEGFDTANGLVTRDVMLSRMETYIDQVFDFLEENEYIDMFYAYDVVNEAWMEDGSMRDNLWKQTIGDDYLWYAFYYADKRAPESVDLYYNDYNEQYKTETLINFVNTLVDENGEYLIDGIGFQAHLYTSDDLSGYFRMMDKVAETGLKIELTELDVCLGAWQKTLPSTEENLEKQGRFYYNLIAGILERVDNGTLNLDAITFWGVNDANSWRASQSPLLYSIVFKEKPAYYGVLQMKEKVGLQ